MFFNYLRSVTGLSIFESQFFAASIAVVASFVLALVLFPLYIKKLKALNFSSEIVTTKHDPVMPAGILFLIIIVPITLLTSNFQNPYVVSALLVYLFYSVIGAVDDIAKVVNKRKLLRNEISKKDYQYKTDGISATLRLSLYILVAGITAVVCYKMIPGLTKEVTIPFFKGTYELHKFIFIPLMTMVIASLANGVNFTDGFDTLSTVPLITNFTFVAIIAYIASRPDWAEYILVSRISNVQDIIPMVGAVIGVLLGFLWFNSPPSTIIMGDSGSIGLGGMLGIMIVFIKAEFYLPVIAFIFLIEFASSFMQIFWYKMTKKRLFRMAPIHHHFQINMRESKKYSSEGDIKSKITWRFHILSVFLFVMGLLLYLKVR